MSLLVSYRSLSGVYPHGMRLCIWSLNSLAGMPDFFAMQAFRLSTVRFPFIFMI